MNLKWTKDFNIEVEEIDAQHQRFMTLMNRFYITADKILEQTILNKLYNYAEFHFESEEKLMLIYSYTKIHEQKESH